MTDEAQTEAQREFPVVPVPESEYTGAAQAVFAEGFREQFKVMFDAGVDQQDAFELAHMYAIAVAEAHLHQVATIRAAG